MNSLFFENTQTDTELRFVYPKKNETYVQLGLIIALNLWQQSLVMFYQSTFYFLQGYFVGGGEGDRRESPPHAKSENSYILGGAFPPKMEDYELLNIIILNW